MDMEHFIQTVRKYPCLWNTTSLQYRDQELKDAAWGEVVKETGLSSVKEVKLKWKKLRDSYRDALKRQSELHIKDPNGTKKNCVWKYMSHMQFLQPHMNARKRLLVAEERVEQAEQPEQNEQGEQTRNGHEQARSSEESESSRESSPRRATGRRSSQLSGIGRKLDYLCKAAAARRHGPPPQRTSMPDPLDIFFNSMCQSTKRFPYPTQIRIKKALFNAVIEAEESLVAEQQNYAALWALGGNSSSSSEAAARPDGQGDGEGEENEDVKPFL
ncbi:unnamed protein product [Leptosia nina]|uniref:MADF domain-containing protein n=1 Tax=Leptosia nina TaxID=320188 RepID=A0AAV1JP29_9NEOP